MVLAYPHKNENVLSQKGLAKVRHPQAVHSGVSYSLERGRVPPLPL